MSSEAGPLQAGAASFQGFGDIIAGTAQSNALNRAAEIERQNAELDLETGKLNAGRVGILADEKLGNIAAEYGASGVSNNSTSALNVLAASAANAELDKQNVLHGAQVRAINYENQANMDSIGAQSALKGGYMNAIAAVIGGGAKIYGSGAGVEPGNYKPSSYSSDSDMSIVGGGGGAYGLRANGDFEDF